MSQDNRFQVNLAGMIDILSNHLYSDQDVYLRELLQNGTDAIRARRLYDAEFDSGEIHVSIQSNHANYAESDVKNHSKTLVFSDNGIGLTAEEIAEFLATIASSSKGDKNFDNGSREQSFIGRFGIGLLSCFVVTSEIRLLTHSAKHGTVWEWCGKGDGTYTIKELPLAARPDIGTTVFLNYKADIASLTIEESLDNVRECLFRYGACLEVPIYLKDNRYTDRHQLRWINQYSNVVGSLADVQTMSAADILKLGRVLLSNYENDNEAVSLQDYFVLQSESGNTFAVAYVVPYAVSTHARKLHSAYLNRMYVSNEIEKVMPDWAFFTRTVIWTNELQPVASREAFYHNDTLERVSTELAGSLKQQIKTMPEKALQRLLTNHHHAFKALACEDEDLLRFIYPYLSVHTLNGEEALKHVMSQSDVIFYTQSVDDFRQIADVMRAQQLPLINGGYVYDSTILHRLNKVLGREVFKLFRPEDVEFAFKSLYPDEANALADLLSQVNIHMAKYEVEVVLNYFSPHDIPMLYLSNQNAQGTRELKRVAEASNALFGSILDNLQQEAPLAQLYLNFHNEVIQSVFFTGKSKMTMISVIEVLYVQALLMGHYPLKKNEIQLMNQGLLHIIKSLKSGDGSTAITRYS